MLLDAWDRGRALPQALRPPALLAACRPDATADELARLSLGRRDARLLELRRQVFGPDFTGLTDCPSCGDRLELGFRAEDVLSEPTVGPEEELALDLDGYAVRFRLPNSLDLAALTGPEDVTAARRRLLERCLLEAHSGGVERAAAELPEAVIAGIAARMAQADPQADVRLSLDCPACGHRWQAPLDVAAFFGEELNAWADRTLREVHILASAYGWSEAEILALPPSRRHGYLEMIRG
jgi:hypothetical protein